MSRAPGRPPLPRVLLVTAAELSRKRLEEVLDEVLPLGGEVGLLLRRPGACGRGYLKEARWVQARCRPHANPFFIHERLDVALLLGAHLHLPAYASLPRDVRPMLPPRQLLSTSVHDEAEARAAIGADLALVSPVFPPGSKPGDTRPPLGISGFRRLAGTLPCAPFALGGMTLERLSLLGPGAAGVALMSAVWGASAPGQVVLVDGGRPEARERV